MEKISVRNIIKEFNRSEFRRSNIPQELVSGWPCIRNHGKTLCITIPYFARKFAEDGVMIFPLYCSVTFPVGNAKRLMDFTVYPFQNDWAQVDYSKPVGKFKHEALKDVATKGEYDALRSKLFEYFDMMINCVLNRQPFEKEAEMRELFSKLMEPGHFGQYKKINNKFYSHFCEL